MTNRKRREQQLDAHGASLEILTAAAADVLEAQSGDRIQTTLVDVVRDLFDAEISGLFLYDESNHHLAPAVARTHEGSDVDISPIEPGTSKLWNAFVDSQIEYTECLSEAWCDELPSSDFLIIPLGDHGLIFGTTGKTNYSREQEFELAQLITSLGTMALENNRLEERVATQKRSLQRTEDRFEELTQITEYAVRFQQELWKTDSPQTVYQTVTTSLEELSAVGFVWIGEYAPGEDQLRLEEWKGSAAGYVDDMSVAVTDDNPEPSVRAIVEEDTVVVENIASGLDDAVWRTSALESGLASVLSVPIAHNNMLYGVLSVYFTDSLEFPSQRKVAIEGLASLTARALTSLDHRRALGTKNRVELEFETSGVDSPLKRVASATGADLRLESVVTHSDGIDILYGTLNGASAEQFSEATDTFPSIRMAEILEAGDGRLRFELGVQQDVPPSTVIDLGGTFEELHVTPDRCVMRASFFPSVSINTIIETVIKRHPDWNLKARRTISRDGDPPQTGEEMPELSDRQASILNAAVESGYFDWPRETTAEEIAEKIGVSPPTIHRHLRAGMKSLSEWYTSNE